MITPPASVVAIALSVVGAAGPEPFQFQPVHRALLREMVVVWDPTEAGAPVIHPAAPYGSGNPWRDVERIARESGLRVSKEQAMALHRDTEAALGILLAQGTLAPGRYTLPDPLGGRKSPFHGITLIDMAESAITRGLVTRPPHARGKTIALDFTAEHRALLQVAQLEWPDEATIEDEPWFASPAVDPKRPYGNATFYFHDLAEALGLKRARPVTESDHGLSDEQIRRLGRLHHESDLALQVFLRRAEVAPGTYAPAASGSLRWKKVD